MGRRFIYTGDPGVIKQPERQTAEVFGHTFALHGKAVEVDDAAAAKLAGNNHFKEVGTKKRKPAKKKEKPPAK